MTLTCKLAQQLWYIGLFIHSTVLSSESSILTLAIDLTSHFPEKTEALRRELPEYHLLHLLASAPGTGLPSFEVADPTLSPVQGLSRDVLLPPLLSPESVLLPPPRPSPLACRCAVGPPIVETACQPHLQLLPEFSAPLDCVVSGVCPHPTPDHLCPLTAVTALGKAPCPPLGQVSSHPQLSSPSAGLVLLLPPSSVGQ